MSSMEWIHVMSSFSWKIFVLGSEKPAEVESQARLYSMMYCPFAHRIRLVLSLKDIPHDIVNINLQSKPQWFLDVRIESFSKGMIMWSACKEFLSDLVIIYGNIFLDSSRWQGTSLYRFGRHISNRFYRSGKLPGREISRASSIQRWDKESWFRVVRSLL